MIYEVVTDLSRLSEIDVTKEIFCDIEAGGTEEVYKVIGNEPITQIKEYVKITSIQVFQEHWDKVMLFNISMLPSYAVEYIWGEISKCTLVGHNFGSDLEYFSRVINDFDIDKVKWEDTFYASRLTKPSWQEYALDKCLTKALGYDPYAREGLTKKEMQKSFIPDIEFTPEQCMYASLDVFLLPKLYHEVVPQAKDSFNYKLDKKIAEINIGMTVGMPVDIDKLHELANESQEKITEVNKILGDLNVNSYMQVRKLLGLEYSSDEITLRIIAGRKNGLEGFTVFKHPKLHGNNLLLEPNYVHTEEKEKLANAILTKRKNMKMLNFIVRAKRWMGEDDHRITARFSPHAITGRVQPSDENLSQYPRAMKKMWGINPEIHGDRVLVYADYSQLELRTVCAILPERNMERAYRNKIDLHTFAANNLAVDESKLPKSMPKRSLAKYLNFLMLYGGGIANFQKTVCKNSGVWLETEVCSKSAKDWKNGFSDIKHWHEINAKSKGHMDKTIGGRRYKAKSYTDLNNIKVQGSGSEVAKLAWVYQYKFNVVEEDVHIVNFVHDAFVLDCPNIPEVYERVAERLGKVMKLSWQEVMKNAPIDDLPMPVDVLVGRNWADLEYETNIMHEVTIDGEYDPNLMEEVKTWK